MRHNGLLAQRMIPYTQRHKNSKGDTITITKKVEGPVCIAACTTDEQIYEDNANRSFLIYLDDSKEQDNRIMDYQRAEAAGQIDHLAGGGKRRNKKDEPGAHQFRGRQHLYTKERAQRQP